jgi:hypothetical protein
MNDKTPPTMYPSNSSIALRNKLKYNAVVALYKTDEVATVAAHRTVEGVMSIVDLFSKNNKKHADSMKFKYSVDEIAKKRDHTVKRQIMKKSLQESTAVRF